MSTSEEVELIADHRGLITGEVCPHHLYFNVDDYDRLGSRVQMNPSIKTAADNAALWEALADGRVQVIATDHAPHTQEEKARPYPESPSGLPSVELLMPLMLDAVAKGKLTLRRLVDALCDAPARVWDVVDKGRIAEGYDADLVLVDTRLKKRVGDSGYEAKSGWSPWHGVELTGWPVSVWVNGQLALSEGTIHDDVRGAPLTFDHDRGGYWAENQR